MGKSEVGPGDKEPVEEGREASIDEKRSVWAEMNRRK
jgi:hypothetical protein